MRPVFNSATPMALALTLMLGGCGSDGGGGTAGGPTVSIPTPTPTPTTPLPSPTPSPTASPNGFPPAPFGLTASRDFPLLGWIKPTGATDPVPVTSGLMQLRWSATTSRYEVTIPGLVSGSLRQTFPGNNPIPVQLVEASGSVSPLILSLFDGKPFDPPFESVGTLRIEGVGIVGFGLDTASGTMPMTGKPVYLAGFGADGMALLQFDFAAGAFAGSIRLAWVDAWGPYSGTQYALTDLRYTRGGTAFSAKFAVPGAPIDGTLTGRFMGPQGSEMAIAWRGPVRNPHDGSWEIAQGVWVGRPCPECAGIN